METTIPVGDGGGGKIPMTKLRKIYGIRDDDDDPDNFVEWDNDFEQELEVSWDQLASDISKPSKTIIPSSTCAEDLLTFEQLLSAIGFMGLDEKHYREMFQSYPSVQNDDGKRLTVEETNLGNIYKCDAYHHQCYFTTDCPKSFEKHLKQQHPNQSLYCFYCTKANDDHNCDGCDSFAKPSVLLDHIKDQHSSSLNYQCNLCFYRALTPDHIFIHQAYEHPDSFLETIAKLDENPVDDIKTCKIIVCVSPNDKIPNLSKKFYLEQYGSKRKDDETTSGGNHCIYCNTPYNKDHLLSHFVVEHPQFPILSELHGKDYSESLHHEGSVTMIDDFLDRLRIITAKPTYDEKTMNAAFQAYNGQTGNADSSQSKGTKRKQSDDDDHPANRVEEDEMDSTNLGTSTTTDLPAVKRRRLLGGYIPVPTWKQTKTAVGMATTAIVALGFYQFAQYLPFTIKKLPE